MVKDLKKEFISVVDYNVKKYPNLMAEDLVKLAFQNANGPRHLISAEEKIERELKEECDCVKDSEDKGIEKIGNGFSRFYLDGRGYSPLLKRLFLLSIIESEENDDLFESDIAYLKSLGIEGLDDKINSQPSHSATYRDYYNPHYRVLKSEYAFYYPVLRKIETLLSEKEDLIIAIDGRCLSGKSRLSSLITEVFDANVFHLDDFYLSPEKRNGNWKTEYGLNIDFERFNSEVIKALVNKSDVVYRKYICYKDEMLLGAVMPYKRLNIVEGSYSHLSSLSSFYDYKIFLTCRPDIQEKRLMKREGDYSRTFKSLWIPLEESYIAAKRPDKYADLVFDTSFLE